MNQSLNRGDNRRPCSSYDGTVRVFDTRKLPLPLTTMDVGGGAWRVKWHPSPDRKNDLLVACMHSGFKIIDIGQTAHLMQNDLPHGVRKQFDRHESLAYGADWSFHQETRGEETLIASCSFYDHTLYLWTG